MFTSTYVLGSIAVAVILLVSVLIYMSGYTICPSNKLLIVNGSDTGKTTNTDGTVDHSGGAKIYQGGSVFVMPILYTKSWLSLEPMGAMLELKGTLTKNNVPVNVSMQFMYAINTEDREVMQRAVRYFANRKESEIEKEIKELALGSLRSTIASLEIEELIADREAFNAEIKNDLEVELAKMGMQRINHNIRDISDDSNYIKSLGQKATTEVTQRAATDIAEAEKVGAIAQANAAKDQQIETQKIETEKQLAIESNDREREVGLQEQETLKQIAVASNNRERATSLAEQKKQSSVELADIAATQAESIADSTEREALANTKREQAVAKSKEDIATAKQSQMIAEESNVQLVQIEIEKRSSILEAEASAATIKIEATAKADAILLEATANAKSIELEYNAKAEGFKNIVSAGGDQAIQLMVAEQLPMLARIQAEAMSNLKIDKVVVMGGSSNDGAGIKNLVREFTSSMPAAHEMAKAVGVELPKFLGQNDLKD